MSDIENLKCLYVQKKIWEKYQASIREHEEEIAELKRKLQDLHEEAGRTEEMIIMAEWSLETIKKTPPQQVDDDDIGRFLNSLSADKQPDIRK